MVQGVLSERDLTYNGEANAGCPLGYAWPAENWKNGKRQPAGKAYNLEKTTIFTEAFVKRILIDEESKAVSGIELLDERTFTAAKEVLICCGGIKTPQLLMLSGVDPSKYFSSHGLATVFDLPVSQNLHEHTSVTLYWKLKHPERGLAIGSPLFMSPEFKDGNPVN